MSDSTALYRAKENLRMMGTCPTWYDHLDKIEAAMAEQDRIYKVRTAAGWDLDEGGWYAPCPEKTRDDPRMGLAGNLVLFIRRT